MFIKAHLVPLLAPGPVPDGDVVLNVVHHTQQVTTVSLSSRNLVSSYHSKKIKMNLHNLERHNEFVKCRAVYRKWRSF